MKTWSQGKCKIATTTDKSIDVKSIVGVDEKLLDKQIAALQWWVEFRRTNNETFFPLLKDKHRFLVMMGGGGSGKSIFAGRLILERVTNEPGHRWLVCRKVANTLRNSCFVQLVEQAAEYYSWAKPKSNQSDMTITFENGSKILFAGLDDVNKLKSIFNITGIWVEEAAEIAEYDFNQLNIRLRGKTKYFKQLIVTFNPISATHWLKKRFFDRDDPRARTHKSTYKDNRFLPPEDVQTLEDFRLTDEYYYMVYALGQWGVTGKTVFNGRAVSERIAHLERENPIIKQGLFEYTELPDGVHIEKPRWVDYDSGPIKIFKEPVAGRPYVIGGDTAGDGSDHFVAQVLDNITGEQVAILRHQYDEDTYARQIYCMGKYYNTALIGIETNYSTYPTKLVQKMGYSKLYVRQREDNFDGQIQHAYGFDTNSTTRPVIIGELVKAMRTGLHLVNDKTTLEEMLTFVRPEKNPERPEAEQGGHDDTIMALAIAWYIRPQQSMSVSVSDEAATAVWSRDMWEDYYGADADGKAYLISKWGRPK